MKKSEIILSKIKEIQIKDHQINQFLNEEGEGYCHDSVPEKMWDEYLLAQKNEFEMEWTPEIIEKRKVIWNEFVKHWDIKKEKMLPSLPFKKIHGFNDMDIKQAIEMHKKKLNNEE